MNFLFHYMARWKAVNWTRYHELFVNLARMGHTVHVVQSPSFSSFKETNFQEIQVDLPPNLYLHDVAVNPRIWNADLPLKKLFNKGYYTCRSAATVKEMIRQFNIDVLFVYNIPQYPLFNLGRCTKVFDIADDYLAMLKTEMGSFNNPAVIAAGRFILNSMIKKSDITLVVSSVLRDSFPTASRGKMRLLPNGVNIRDFSLSAECDRIREMYPTPIIGYVGCFEYFIDLDLILKTAESLKNLTFLLVGTGREFADVQRRVQSRALHNVILTGPVPHEKIAHYIGAMDICLNVFKPLPISHAACPIKLFEYLAMKKPVISTRLREVEKIDKGFLSYADTPEETCSAIKNLLDNREYAQRCAHAGYDLVKNEYDWPALVEKFVAMVKAVKDTV